MFSWKFLRPGTSPNLRLAVKPSGEERTEIDKLLYCTLLLKLDKVIFDI